MIFTYNLKKNNALPTQDQWKTASDVYEETLSRKDKSNLIDGEPIFLAVQKQAVPPGGLDAFVSRLKQKLQYPSASKRAGIEGKVFIKFVVKKDGTLTNFEFIKGINTDIDLEALRVLKQQATQRWTPATQDGKTVNSQYVMPIEFKLH